MARTENSYVFSNKIFFSKKMSLAANLSALSCKMQQRNLYILQSNLRKWCQKHDLVCTLVIAKALLPLKWMSLFIWKKMKSKLVNFLFDSFRAEGLGNGEYYANFPKTFHPIAFSKFCFWQLSLEPQGFILVTPDFLVFSFFFPLEKKNPQNISLLPDVDQQIDHTSIQVMWFLKCYWFNMLPSNSTLHYWSETLLAGLEISQTFWGFPSFSSVYLSLSRTLWWPTREWGIIQWPKYPEN